MSVLSRSERRPGPLCSLLIAAERVRLLFGCYRKGEALMSRLAGTSWPSAHPGPSLDSFHETP